MPHRSSVFALLPLFLLAPACGDSATGESSTMDDPEGSCALDEPSLLVPLPADWDPDSESARTHVQVVGDRLLYGFRTDDKGGRIELVDLCGGEPELVTPAHGSREAYFTVDSAVGPVVYSRSIDDTLVAIDRLDVPGLDEPRTVGILEPPPAEGGLSAISSIRLDVGVVFELGAIAWEPGADPPIGGVAGVSLSRSNYDYLSGDPDDGLVRVGEDIVRHVRDGERIYLHDQDGEVHVFDAKTGERAQVLDGARYIEAVRGPGNHLNLVYQVLGDDQSEPVRVRDLETGDDREVTVNDFAAISWGRGAPSKGAGMWMSSSSEDNAVIALAGPDGDLVEAYRLDTLAPLAVPEHVGFGHVESPQGDILLVLPDPADHVLALWEPLSGGLVEVYRGPAEALHWHKKREGDRFLHDLKNEDGSVRRVAVDLTSGETTTVIPRLGTHAFEIEDGRLLSTLEVGPGEQEIALVDPETGVYDVLVERTSEWSHVEGVGVVYLDLEASEPGIWTRPFPAP